MSADTLTDLRRLFAWRDRDHHAARCGSLERSHLTAVASKINTRLDDDARADLERLPDDAYLAIMRGADTFFAALYGGDDDLAGCVARWIAVERAELGAPAAPDGTLRGAGCDRHVEIAGGRVVAIAEAPRVPGTRIASTSRASCRPAC